MRLFSLFLSVCLAVFSICGTNAEEFQWQNPLEFQYVEGQTAPRTEVRDPCIIRDGDNYYMVFTMYTFSNREERRLTAPNQGGSPGIAIYRSADLKTWTFENWLVKSEELPENCPYKNRFWAPEIHKIQGKYYLVFTADNWIKGEYNAPGKWGTAGYAFIGVADKVTGPYEHITWVDGGPCDMSLFGDDGKIYAVSPKYDVFVRQIDLSRLHEGKISWVGEEIKAVACRNDDVGLDDHPDYLEGPWMEKINGKYYLFHAAIYKYPGQNKAHEYWTQLAYADHPMGPWKKDPKAQVFKGGHLTVFDGPGGHKWYSYRHENGVRGVHGRPCVDLVEFNADGTIRSSEPSITLQTLEQKTIQPVERSELSTKIFDALNSGEKKINIPKGNYALELKGGRPMVFENLKDVEINGNGSDVLCRVPSQIVLFRNCENVSFKGFTFDSAILPFTQGTVVAVDPEKGLWLDVAIHQGYESHNVTDERAQVFDPKTQRLKKNLWTLGDEKMERLENGNWRMTFRREDKNRKIEVGDLMVLGTRSTEPLSTHTFVLENSKNCTLEEITLYFSNCFSFLEHACHGNTYLRCKLVKKINDPTKGFPRLRSGNADSFHSKFATLGPRVEECEFYDHGDDCVAINGNFYIVVSSNGNKVLVLERYGHQLQIKVGDPVRFTSYEGTMLGDSTVDAIALRTDIDREIIASTLRKYELAGGSSQIPRNLRIYELTLKTNMDVGSGGNVYALNRIGNGFVVKNNKVGFTRARGLLIKASEGEITGNIIDGCELGGIIVAPELYWLEAGFSSNLKIENNIIRDCVFHHNRWGDSQPAAISVAATNAKGDIMEAGAMKNIVLRNNTISGSPYPAMFLTSIDGGLVEGNVISPPKENEKREHGKRYAERHHLEYDQPFWLINNKRIEQR